MIIKNNVTIALVQSIKVRIQVTVAQLSAEISIFRTTLLGEIRIIVLQEHLILSNDFFFPKESHFHILKDVNNLAVFN